jgi:phage shock protein PspC (stress-responsive transcriptional regulator)
MTARTDLPSTQTQQRGPIMNKKFTLDRNNKKLMGVCAGLGNYFNIDPLLVRIAWVVATLVFGLPLLVYFVIGLVAD